MLLEVFDDRGLADDWLAYYAETVVGMGLAETHGVYTAPTGGGAWGVFLKAREAEGSP